MHDIDSIIYQKSCQKWTTSKSGIPFPVQQFQFFQFNLEYKDFSYVLFKNHMEIKLRENKMWEIPTHFQNIFYFFFSLLISVFS